MVSFRKSLMVVALLALCAVMAMAQVSVTGSTSILRSEGVTELLNPITVTSILPIPAPSSGTFGVTIYSTTPSVVFTSNPGKNDGMTGDITLTPTGGVAIHGVIQPGGSLVMFAGVKLVGDAGTPASLTSTSYGFTLDGIRLDVHGVVTGGLILPTGVNLAVVALPADNTGPQGLFAGQILYNLPNVAYAIPTFNFSVKHPTGLNTGDPYSFSQCDKTTNVATPTAKAPDFSNYIFNLDFTEGFSKSFLTKIQEGMSATSGTRLSVTFSNLPGNTQLWVPTNPVSPIGGDTIGAQLILNPNADGSGGTGATLGNTPLNWAPVTPGTPVIYEITLSNASTVETMEIPVAVAFTGTPSLAAATGGQVMANYAPQTTDFTFSATAPIPRFSSAPVTKTGLYGVIACSTSLLFPYIVTGGGYNVGLAISNTGADPFGNTGQAGTCDFSFYGATGAPAAPVMLGGKGFMDTTAIAAGTTSAYLASDALGADVSFQGYAIAVCNFQYAHGYAFIVGNSAKSTFAHGYLALVLQKGADISRGSATGQWEKVGN
jgi:hypothetical protein